MSRRKAGTENDEIHQIIDKYANLAVASELCGIDQSPQ
jgi:hypothetical protein